MRPRGERTARRPIGKRVAAGELRGAVPAAEYHLVFVTGADATRAWAQCERAASVRPLLWGPAFHADSLRHLGVGLTPDDLARLDAVTVAFAVFSMSDDLATGLHVATTAARAGAIAGQGWIVDPLTSRVFSIAAFDEQFPPGFPLSTAHLVTTFQVRDTSGGVMLLTAGLTRFGLPELLLRNVPSVFVDDLKIIVDAAAQTLIERSALPRDGALDIETATLAREPWPSLHRRIMENGGTGTLTLRARWSNGVRRADDAPPLIELEIDGATPEAMAAARWAFFGGERAPMQNANGDIEAALVAARDRALTEFAALASHFARGVPEFEHLQVKAPFATDSRDVEWMWVEVHEWKGTRLRGILTNQPFDIAALEEGAEVEVQQGELFDYLHRRADGTIVGGETNKILAGE